MDNDFHIQRAMTFKQPNAQNKAARDWTWRTWGAARRVAQEREDSKPLLG